MSDEESLRAVYDSRVRACETCRKLWPSTFEAALASPVYSRLMRLILTSNALNKRPVISFALPPPEPEPPPQS
jgi:hypothetical protein